MTARSRLICAFNAFGGRNLVVQGELMLVVRGGNSKVSRERRDNASSSFTNPLQQSTKSYSSLPATAFLDALALISDGIRAYMLLVAYGTIL